MNIFKMDVSKKEAGEYVAVGTVEVPMFSLQEFGINIEADGVDTETGLLSYSDPKVAWVYSAICAATKADARNKLITGTATLKPGAKISDSVEDLIARAERSGAALQLNREFLASFAKYLAEKSGKSAAVQALYNSMVKNRQTIALSSQARKDGLLHQIAAYVEQASAEEAEKFANILATIGEMCEAELTLDDDEL